MPAGGTGAAAVLVRAMTRWEFIAAAFGAGLLALLLVSLLQLPAERPAGTAQRAEPVAEAAALQPAASEAVGGPFIAAPRRVGTSTIVVSQIADSGEEPLVLESRTADVGDGCLMTVAEAGQGAAVLLRVRGDAQARVVELRLDGQERQLATRSASGDWSPAAAMIQHFSDPDGALSVTIALDAALDAAKPSSGTLTVSTSDGRALSLPVEGRPGC